MSFRIPLLFAFAFLAAGVSGCGGHPVAVPPVASGVERAAAGISGGDFTYGVGPHVRAPLLTASQCNGSGGLQCFTPTSMKSGYDFPSSATGAGARIVIVDAFGSPTVTADLQRFDALVGLNDPAPGQFTIVYPGGKPSFNPSNRNQLNWATETDMDVQWAHALAPGAAIVLVVAANDGGNSLNTAQQYAVTNYPGSIMSLSFGVAESAISGGGNNTQLQQAHQVYQNAVSQGVVVLSASGDGGATALLGSAADPLYPSSDPLVTAVGGTDLALFHNGNYRAESVWNDFDAPVSGCSAPQGATGGAPSTIWPAPSYQSAYAIGGMRTTSDVAFNASACTGVVVYLGFPGLTAGLYAVGGTSQAVPEWAAILADVKSATGGKPLAPANGTLNDALYAIGAASTGKGAAFHDVTNGDNVTNGFGYAARAGWDPPTGFGTPDVTNLIAAFAAR